MCRPTPLPLPARNINMHTALTTHERRRETRGPPPLSIYHQTTPLSLPPHTLTWFSVTQSSRVHVPARLTPGELFTPRARLRLAPRPTYSTVAQSGTWLGLGLGLGLGSAREATCSRSFSVSQTTKESSITTWLGLGLGFRVRARVRARFSLYTIFTWN